MQASEPTSKKEAKLYCGRKVRKAFRVKNGGKTLRYFTGTVIEVFVLNREINYKIKYEDSDEEDIAWTDLAKILLPIEATPEPTSGRPVLSGDGLVDATNRQGAKGVEAPGSKRLHQSAFGRATTENHPNAGACGLTTPAAAAGDGLEPSGHGTLRHGRARGLGAGDGGMHMEDDGGGSGAGPPGTVRSRRGAPRQQLQDVHGEVEQRLAEQQQQEEEEASERPPKRRATADRDGANAENEHRQQEAPVPEDGQMVFVARGGEGLAGHVARVHLENFMCHHHFEVDMGNHVTLISGQNGSGKSAIMQALMLCLGLSARETGRGTNVQGFVRTGAHDAKVQVTLWNTGPEAFRPETFGSRITVERVLRANGTSNYALLDARMRKVQFDKGQSVREVLNQMLEHFSIDAGNPIVVITQDLARNFLSASKDDTKIKYNMFVEGTLLQKTQDSLKESNKYVTQQAQNLARCAKDLNAERQKEAELKQKLDKIRSADTLLEARDVYEKAVVWRAVQQMEEDLAAASKAAQTSGPEVVDFFDRYLKALAAAKQETMDRKREMEEKLQQHEDIMKNHSAHVAQLLKAANESRSTRERAYRQQRAAQGTLDQLTKDKAELETRLEKETSDKTAEARRRVEEHQQRMTEKSAEVQQAGEAVTAAQQAHEAAKNEVDQLTQQGQAIQNNIHYQRQLVTETQARLQQVAAGQGNRLAMFHAAQLDRLIQQNLRSFRYRPIGPMGALLTVTDERWLLAAEVALGASFRDYLVGCSQDATLLRRLMDQAAYGRAGIITTNFNAPPHPVPDSSRPASGLPMIDVLRVQDPAAAVPVLNYLIDKYRIEGLALVENAQQGRNIVYQEGARNTVAMDKQGNRWRLNNGMQWGEPNRNKRFEHVRLVADMSQYMANLRADLERHEAELGAHHEDEQALVQKLGQAQAHVAECGRLVQAAVRHKCRLTAELNRLAASAPELPRMEEDEEAGIVLTQLASLQGEMANSQIDFQNAQEALRIAEQAYAQAHEQMNAEKARYTELVGSVGDVRHAMTEVKAELDALDATAGNVRSKRHETVLKLENLRRCVEAAEAQLRDARARAEEVCSREEGERALAAAEVMVRPVVAKKLERQRRAQPATNLDEHAQRELLEKTVRANMNYNGLDLFRARAHSDIAKVMADAGCKDRDPEDLERELEAVHRKSATALARYRRAEQLVTHFQALHDKQVRNFERLRSDIERITQAKFRKYMHRRDHEGRLVWDHTERTLRVWVKPRGRLDPNVQPVEDLKQLSGGERSYTTISLLLAVGASTESPFRCMDEYDVFMDSINRRVATETLLEFAYENSGYQYIFLTPQDLQAVRDARENVIRRCRVQLPAAFLKTVPIRPARPNDA